MNGLGGNLAPGPTKEPAFQVEMTGLEMDVKALDELVGMLEARLQAYTVACPTSEKMADEQPNHPQAIGRIYSVRRSIEGITGRLRIQLGNLEL
jgi:hypothetical protein